MSTAAGPAVADRGPAENAFAGVVRPRAHALPRSMGAEVEFIPVESLSGRRCPDRCRRTAWPPLPFLRLTRPEARPGTRDVPPKAPVLHLPAARGGAPSRFEPGRQSRTATLRRAVPRSALSLALLRAVVLPAPCRRRSAEGIDLLPVGHRPPQPPPMQAPSADPRQALRPHGGVPRATRDRLGATTLMRQTALGTSR